MNHRYIKGDQFVVVESVEAQESVPPNNEDIYGRKVMLPEGTIITVCLSIPLMFDIEGIPSERGFKLKMVQHHPQCPPVIEWDKINLVHYAPRDRWGYAL